MNDCKHRNPTRVMQSGAALEMCYVCRSVRVDLGPWRPMTNSINYEALMMRAKNEGGDV